MSDGRGQQSFATADWYVLRVNGQKIFIDITNRHIHVSSKDKYRCESGRRRADDPVFIE
jgi:hypothetical protein